MDDELKTNSTDIAGLNPVRTARLISSLIAVFGLFAFTIERVLSMVYSIANNTVKMGLGMSDSYMVRFATENISTAKKLFGILYQVKAILPAAENALLALFIFSVILFVVSAFGFVFPKSFCHVLVALKLLKWQNKGLQTDVACVGLPVKGKRVSKKIKSFGAKITNLCKRRLAAAKKIQVKYWIFMGCALFFVLVLVFCVRGCPSGGIFSGLQNASEELREQASFYINAQKSYFVKNKAVGGPKALNMPDSVSTEYFTYRVTGSRFVATLKKEIENCPVGSRWIVNASTKGFFTVDLVLYRNPPKDTNCTIILPEFKKLGLR